MSLLLLFNQTATGDATVSPPAAVATASAPAPTILYDYAIAVPQATATASAPAPTIAISLLPPQAVATASAPAPNVSIRLLPPQAVATATAPSPIVALTLFPPQAVATASCPVPVINAGTVTITLVYPLRTALASSVTRTETTVKATRTEVPRLGTYSQ